MYSKALKELPGYFIDEHGKVFRLVSGKEEELKATKSKKTGRLFFVHDKKSIDYLNLMIKYFCPNIKETDKVSYRVGKDGRIGLKAIRIKPFTSNILDKQEELKMHEYKCSDKCSSSNSRCADKLTTIQIYISLKIHDFKCVFCGVLLHPGNWHLDHYHPLAQGGKNVFENIVPSCPTCNLMKGALTGEQFYKRCCIIVNAFLFKDSYHDHSKVIK